MVNAIAHRDYTSAGAVQVSVFSDRVEARNPGTLPPPLTPESLRQPHGSIARNPRICEALFLTHYIEKYGTGTLMMIRESLAHALPEPDFARRGGEFTIAVWRNWLTEKEYGTLLPTSPRRKKASSFCRERAKRERRGTSLRRTSWRLSSGKQCL
jgi:predicted HTH transcriptional regulator